MIRLWRSDDRGSRWQVYLEHEAQNPWLAMALPPAPGSRPYNSGVFGIGSRIFRPSGSRRVEGRVSPHEPAILDLVYVPSSGKEYHLYAATAEGIFVSRDQGKAWKSYNEGLPEEPILSLVASPEYQRDKLLYALSLGGVLWRREVNEG